MFGDPTGRGPWAWRAEGHHLSLNFTSVDGRLAVTPLFMGANRAEVPIALLASANVGYFACLILALATTWMLRRTVPGLERPFRAPRGAVGLGLFLAAFNTVLLAGAGAAWGWHNIALGIGVLIASVVLLTPRHGDAGREDEIDVRSADATRTGSKLAGHRVR